MKKTKNTFPNNKINTDLLTILLICCSSGSKNIVNDEDFINIYSYLLIINELKIDKEKKDALTAGVLKNNNVSMEDINQAIFYYKQKPEDWVTILQKVRDRIRKLKTENNILQSGNSGTINVRPVNITPRIMCWCSLPYI